MKTTAYETAWVNEERQTTNQSVPFVTLTGGNERKTDFVNPLMVDAKSLEDGDEEKSNDGLRLLVSLSQL